MENRALYFCPSNITQLPCVRKWSIKLTRSSLGVCSFDRVVQEPFSPLSYAAFVAEFNGGYEAGPVLMRGQEVPVLHPPFLDIGHDGMFPVDASWEDYFSLELLS